MNETSHAVFVNREELSTAKLELVSSRYGVRIPAGRYWYDIVCGAWGIEGGPALGFTAAGLELAGPLPADISGRGTGIFINGREIHFQDQAALIAMLGVTYPGRYRLDAAGNLATEAGAFLVNLVQVAQAAQPARRTSGAGGLYSGAGGTVGTDGSGGVLFYTPNSSGGYNSYNN